MCNICNNTNCCGCNQNYVPQNICNECEQVQCDCPVKDLSTDCVLYDKDDIVCQKTTIVPKNTILSEALNFIVSWICTQFEEVKKYLRLINTGTGASIYSGDNLIGEKKLRKINSSSSIITVAENTDDISIGVDEDELNDFIEVNQKTYSIENIGEGVEIYKIPDNVVGDNTEFNLRTIISDNLEIIEEENQIRINTPVSTSNLSFYVDVNSTADTETGTLASPFKTLNKALDAFIGNGTWFNPQYKGYKITLLSACQLLETPGVDYNGYVNLDINNLYIEGNGFYLGLYSNPSPDYYPISTRRMVLTMPKTANVLDYAIDMRFNNVVLQRTGTNAIVDNLNYSFPTATLAGAFPPQQNGVNLWFTECILTNDTDRLASGNFSTVPNPNDGGNPLLFFGRTVYGSISEAWGVPMVKTEGRNWDKEGGFRLGNSRLTNSSGPGFKAVDTTYNDFYDFNTIGMDNYNRIYESVVDDYYAPRLGTYMIELENVNYFAMNNLRLNWTVPRMTTTELVPRDRIIGGVEAMFKLVNSSLNIVGDSSDQDQCENLVQMDGTSNVYFDGYRNDGQISDLVHGAIKVIAPLPASPKQITSLNSYLRNVIVDETGVDKTYIQQVNGIDNNINNAPHNSYNQYADDVAAKAAGLIRGNVYYNTTIGGLKTIL